MAISYNTGTTAQQVQVAHTVQPTITVPAGVLTGDLILVSIGVFTFTPTGADFTLTATTGHTWTNIGGGVANGGANGGLNQFSKLWVRTATSGDAGDTLTFAFTGTQGSTDQFWWDISVDVWTGAGAVDVIASPQLNNATNTLSATPTVNTATAGDWAVQICAASIDSGGTLSGIPSGTTQRGLIASNSGVGLSIADSNASVGAAGTTIGGGTFTANAQSSWWVQWTLGLSPASGAVQAPLLPFAPGKTWKRRFKHPQALLAPPGTASQNLTSTLATSVTAVGNLKVQVGKIEAGTVTASGALQVKVGKILAGTVTASGNLVRSIGKILPGNVTAAPSVIRGLSIHLAGNVTAVGALATTKVQKLTLAGIATVSGALRVQVRPILLGTVTASATQVLRISKILAGNMTASGALMRLISVTEKGFVTAVGAMTAIKTKLLTLAGNVTAAGQLVRQVRPVLAGHVTAAAGQAVRISLHVLGNVTAAGGLVKQIGKTAFTATATAVGALTTRMARGVILATSVTAVASVGRGLRVGLRAVVTALGNLILTPHIAGVPLPEELNASVSVYSPNATVIVSSLNAGVVIYVINANVDS